VGVLLGRRSLRLGTAFVMLGAILSAVWHFWAVIVYAAPALLVITGAVTKPVWPTKGLMSRVARPM
jgi:hypothetical protein